MYFMIDAKTDVGIVKRTNQDCLSVMELDTCQGRMVFAVLCDGMGGLAQGEVASACVVRAFRDWVFRELPDLCRKPLRETEIRSQWNGIIERQNQKIKEYGSKQGVRMGTTVVAMLLTEDRYYILNVGDSRAYEISDDLRQITKDHSVVAREVALGNLTAEQAERDPRRNVLLQCVGASSIVRPDLFTGTVSPGTVFMICSDGFRHELSPGEILERFCPEVLTEASILAQNTEDLISLVKARRERDNISVILVKTCE